MWWKFFLASSGVCILDVVDMVEARDLTTHNQILLSLSLSPGLKLSMQCQKTEQGVPGTGCCHEDTPLSIPTCDMSGPVKQASLLAIGLSNVGFPNTTFGRHLRRRQSPSTKMANRIGVPPMAQLGSR